MKREFREKRSIKSIGRLKVRVNDHLKDGMRRSFSCYNRVEIHRQLDIQFMQALRNRIIQEV